MPKIKPEQLNASIRDIPLPQNMLELPVSSKGFPVPFFAAKVGDDWDFRVVYPETTIKCMKESLCWICGQQLGRLKAFVAGPMCIVTKTSAEPPCHPTCARYAAVACPFLAMPKMKRNEADLPEGHQPPAGQAILRNPGVAAVLIASDWKPFRDGDGGVLIRMGEPSSVEWYAQRRSAKHSEVAESINSGMGLLYEQCEKEATDEDRLDAYRQLNRQLDEAVTWLPRLEPGEQDTLHRMRL